MGRLLDEDMVINIIKNEDYYMTWADRAMLIEEIKDLPSAQPKQRWIPCSERLPDVAQRVLLSGHGMVMIGMLHSFGKYSLEPTGISYVYPKDDIEAWMPMPESYVGKRIEETDYERAVEQLEHDILYEPTFNQDDGSM